MSLVGLFLSFVAQCHCDTIFEGEFHTTRLVIWGPGQSSIRDCFFADCCTSSDIYGGAIWAEGSETGNSIEDTTILNCSCLGPHGRGGAIYLSARGAVVRRLCASDCVSRCGPFIYVREDAELQDVSALRCAPPGSETTNGGIFADSDAFVTLENANITDCHAREVPEIAPPDGVGLFFWGYGSEVCHSVRYVNFCKLTGRSSVRANLDAVQLDFCNFVGNTNDFIVWTNGAAIAVADCYFKGNSGQYFVSYEAGAALEVTGCYFDQDESGSGTRWTDFGNNHFAAVFTTIAISNFETEVCPGAPSPTDSFAPSAVYNQSLPHAASNWPFEATAFFTSPEPTGQFTGRLHIHRGLGQLVKMGRFLFLVVL